MKTFSDRIRISAAPEAVWVVLVDVENWATWTPTIESVVALEPAPSKSKVRASGGEAMRLGSRYEVDQPDLPIARMEVTEYTTCRNFTWKTSGRLVWAAAEHIVTPVDGGCRVELFLHFFGPLASTVVKVKGSLVRRYLRTEALCLRTEAMRQQAEQESREFLHDEALP